MGTHEYEEDPRNEDVLISVNGELFPRKEAKVSVFDSGFLLGDGVWESFRLHNGKLVFVKDIWTGFSTEHRKFPLTPGGLGTRLCRRYTGLFRLTK